MVWKKLHKDTGIIKTLDEPVRIMRILPSNKADWVLFVRSVVIHCGNGMRFWSSII